MRAEQAEVAEKRKERKKEMLHVVGSLLEGVIELLPLKAGMAAEIGL
jgi:hypothetical protein